MLALRTHTHLSADPMSTLLKEWNRMWPSNENLRRSQPAQRARLAMREHEDRHELYAALPGLKRTELSIEVSERTLVLRKSEPESGEEVQVENTRRPFEVRGNFEHRIALPQDADLDKISAQLEAGILTVTIPKVTAPAPRNIEISGE